MKKAVCVLFLLYSTFACAQMDKALHSGAGFGITLSFSAITHKPTLGLIAGVGAGIGKEMWDAKRVGHDASAMDALTTAAGSVSAFVLWKYAIARKRPKIAAAPPPAQTADNNSPPAALGATGGR